MSPDVSELINLYRFPTGRRLFALRRVRERCGAGEEALAAFLDGAIAHEEASWDLEQRWREGRSLPRHAPEAMALDAKLDRGLGALYTAMGVPIQAYGEDSEQGKAALRLRDLVFPEGVFALSTMSFPEEHEAARRLVERLRGAERAATEAMGLLALVERVEELNVAFGAALNVREDRPSHDQVAAAQEQGQRNLQKVAAWVLGHYLGDSDEERGARRRLLGPILEQNEAIWSHRRRRRRPADVDPETGLEADEATLLGDERGPGSPSVEPEEGEAEAGRDLDAEADEES